MEAGNATSTAGASPLPAEIAEAMRGLTAAEVARAHDLLERAEAAQDPRVARLVVAEGREFVRLPRAIENNRALAAGAPSATGSIPEAGVLTQPRVGFFSNLLG